MKDIIWITYKGRRIPIKTGMKGKFQKKKDDDYELYKQAKEKPDSIDPMTENSTDWEALDKKYATKYDDEKRLEITKNIAKEIYNINEETSPDLLNKKAKELLQFSEGEILEEGEKPYINSNGELERSTESLERWRNNINEKNKQKEMGTAAYLMEKERKKGNYKDEKLNELQIKANNIVDKIKENNNIKPYYNEKTKRMVNQKSKPIQDLVQEYREKGIITGGETKIKLNTLSDYEQYFINQGYSKATALKMAKEIINKRKNK